GGGGLQPGELLGLAEHRRRYGAVGGLGIRDLAPGVVFGLGEHDVGLRRFVRDLGRHVAGMAALRWEEDKLEWHGSTLWRVQGSRFKVQRGPAAGATMAVMSRRGSNRTGVADSRAADSRAA